MANIIPNPIHQVVLAPLTKVLIKGWLVLIFLMAGGQACQQPEYEYMLSDEQLVQILLDIHASDAMVKNFEITARDSMAQIYYQQILEIHEIPQKVFERDIQFLNRNPEKLEAIYKIIENQLEEKKGKTFDSN